MRSRAARTGRRRRRKGGLLINATRVAIVGQAVAPPLFETMLVIGQERVVSRLRRAVEAFAAR